MLSRRGTCVVVEHAVMERPSGARFGNEEEEGDEKEGEEEESGMEEGAVHQREERTELPPLQQPNSLQRKMLEMAGQASGLARLGIS